MSKHSSQRSSITIRRSVSVVRLFEGFLWLLALSCAFWYIASAIQAHAAQKQADEVEVQRPTSGLPSAGVLLGRLELPGIGLSVPVLESCDPATLRRGAGHVPGTAMPGGLGNLAIAAHRDTFFRPLRKVRPGMIVEVVAPGNLHWRYQVDRTEVVTPSQTDVLLTGDTPTMTLITCFPFDYVGSAPQRFIVFAHLLSVDAS